MSDSIDFAKIRLHKDAWGQLVVTLPSGNVITGVEPLRSFPLSDPNRLISLLSGEGHEVVRLPSLDSLNPEARELLRRELAEREFVPVIERIVSTSAPSPPCRWNVETNRGQTSFQLESEDDIRRLGPNGALIADSHGIRYSIPNVEALDSSSQRIVRHFV